jgi:hypothetical protein
MLTDIYLVALQGMSLLCYDIDMEKDGIKNETQNKKRSLLALAIGGLAVVAGGIGLKHIANNISHIAKH